MPDPAGVVPPAQLPAGAKDVLPVEAEELREIEARLAGAAAAFGYREVMTPVLELADVLDRAQEAGLARAFRLFDDQGRVLVLRPDLTIPIARLVAARMRDHAGPVRVRYAAVRFRRARPGRPDPIEERQNGVELVGLDGPEADAEVIALLVRSLHAAGLPDARIALGDAELRERVLDALGVPDDARTALATAATERDLVAWERVVRALGLPAGPADLLARLPALRGGREALAAVRAAAPDAAGACDWLERTLDLLERYGVADAVGVDFGVLREWSYYSGAVFEAYAEGASVPVAVGGRYDGLGARFGPSRPSVGFAITLDVLHRALRARDGADRPREGAVVVGGGHGPGLEMADRLRAAGIPAVAGPDAPDAAERAAADDGWRYVLTAEGGAIEGRDRATGRLARGADPVAVLAELAAGRP